MFSINWILALVALCTWLYFYVKQKYTYWTSRGVKGPTPTWGLGNISERLFEEVHNLEINHVTKYGKVYGSYFAIYPVLNLADAELVKQVLIKDFHHFVNRIEIQAYHELWNKNLFSANDDAWKRLRTISSPSFSSGKLRGMHLIMENSIDKLDSFFARLVSNGDGVMDTKQVIAGFTTDVIAATSFATETNANDDKDSAFVANGRKLFDINPVRAAATFLLPKYALKLLGIDTFFDPKVFNFFIELTKHIVAERRKAGQDGKRNDLVQLLMDASVDEKELDNINYDNMTATDEKEETTQSEISKEVKSRKLTDNEIVANCVFFFIAGYETTGSTLSHCIFELARNQDIQDRLNTELHQALDRFEGEEKSSEEYFDTVMNGIPYLEAVIKETLRRYPPLSQMNRVCAKEGYELAGLNLFKGQIVSISVSGIHLNPEYYPEPRRFDPNRFMPENKHKLVPYSYLPFSLGPRNCIAMRFAYQELKLCLAKIVQKYRFSRTPDTPEELTFKHGSSLKMADPFNIKVERR